MNRPIKFRAWYPPMTKVGRGTMSLEVYENNETEHLNHGIELIQEAQTVLMQYTGLKDTNGKEIFEGDIVKFDNTLMAVKWVAGGFEFFQKAWNELHSISPLCEVIGNIYENPELLNPKNND